MSEQKILGNIGENAVCEYLIQNNFEILERNYCIRGGEIDIIAKNDEYLIFVEVKARKDFKSAAESVTSKKIRFLTRTAKHYLADTENDLQPRFDVACVIISDNNVQAVEYIENAF